MEEISLIIEKGPREGETLSYAPGSVVKVGRVVRGNTIAIKDAGISSKHICIQFDDELCKWTLSDLDSSNGTILNGKILKPNVPFSLKDDDCIKIGELTSIIVKIGVQSSIRSERNPKGQSKSGAGAAAVVETGRSGLGLGLGLDVDLGKNAVAEPVAKRNLRSRAKKAVESKNEANGSSSNRRLKSSKKDEKVSFIPTLKQIPEDSNIDERETADLLVPIEGRRTRSRKRQLPVQPPEDPDLDERKPADVVLPIDGRKTRRGRKRLPAEPLETVQSSDLQENSNNVNETVQSSDLQQNSNNVNESFRVDVTENAVVPPENVENSDLQKNLDTNNGSVQDHVVEQFVSTQEGCEGREAMVSSELAVQVYVDKGKEVAEEIENREDGSEGLVKDTGPDTSRWLDLEKMTLLDFFEYLEVQLPKEIHEKSEEIISHLAEKACKCHEFRLQRNEHDKAKPAIE